MSRPRKRLAALKAELEREALPEFTRARLLLWFLSVRETVEASCQSAPKFDPSSASNFDPFVRRGLAVALVSSELAGIAEARRARVV